jgi:hypothetical protein
MKIAIVASAAALLVTGCANYTWQKPGASPSQLVADKQDCERQARLLADEYELALPGPGGWRQPYDPTGNLLGDRLAEEQRVYSACMRAKGYALVKQDTESRER